MKLDTSPSERLILSVAGALDILLRIGAYSVDDCLKYLGKEPLEREWDGQVDSDYEPIETRFEGGDDGEK